MVLLVIKMTQTQRDKLAYATVVVALIAVVLCLLIALNDIISFTFDVYYKLADIIFKANGAAVFLPPMVIVCTFVTFICNSVGAVFALDQQFSDSLWQKAGAFKDVPTVSAIGIATTTVALILQTVYASRFMTRINRGLNRTMVLYDSDTTAGERARYTLNWIHFQYECCGRDNYKDWIVNDKYRLERMSMRHILNNSEMHTHDLDEGDAAAMGERGERPKLENVCSRNSSKIPKEIAQPHKDCCYIPPSCCRRTSASACFPSLLLEHTIEERYFGDIDLFFHEHGCYQMIGRRARIFVPITISLHALLLLIEIVAYCLVQLLQSVTANTISSLRPDMPNVGWILPFCGKPAEHYVKEIHEEQVKHREQIYMTDEDYFRRKNPLSAKEETSKMTKSKTPKSNTGLLSPRPSLSPNSPRARAGMTTPVLAPTPQGQSPLVSSSPTLPPMKLTTPAAKIKTPVRSPTAVPAKPEKLGVPTKKTKTPRGTPARTPAQSRTPSPPTSSPTYVPFALNTKK